VALGVWSRILDLINVPHVLLAYSEAKSRPPPHVEVWREEHGFVFANRQTEEF